MSVTTISTAQSIHSRLLESQNIEPDLDDPSNLTDTLDNADFEKFSFSDKSSDTFNRLTANNANTQQNSVRTSGQQKNQVAQIFPNAEDAGRSGGRLSYPEDNGPSYPHNANVGEYHGRLPGPAVVKENGRQVLKGTVYVRIIGPHNDYQKVGPELKHSILRGLSGINQINGNYEVRLTFKEYKKGGAGSVNAPTDSLITINVDNQGRTDAKCNGGQACASNGTMNISHKATARVIAHEFSHLLGFGHSSNINSLTYFEGIRNDPVMKQLSLTEMANLIHAYRR